jgi:hypothetical protein
MVVVLDQFDFAWTILQLKAAGLIDLMCGPVFAPTTPTFMLAWSARAARMNGAASAVAPAYFSNSRRRMGVSSSFELSMALPPVFVLGARRRLASIRRETNMHDGQYFDVLRFQDRL